MRLICLAALALLQGRPAAPDDALRIYVARHGQTEWNAVGRMQGSADIPLNENGRRQARQLADRLAGIPFDAIYSSTLQRSAQTAEAFRGRAPIQALAGLNEQSVGGFTGMTQDERDRARREAFERRHQDPDDTLDGGESANHHFARVDAAVKDIRARHPVGNVLIVGHGGTNVHVLRSVMGLTAEQADAIDQANDEVYMVELRPGHPPSLWKLIPPDRLKEL